MQPCLDWSGCGELVCPCGSSSVPREGSRAQCSESLPWTARLPPRAWPAEEFVQQVAAQLPWGHNNGLLDALKSPAERESYARHAIHNGSESPSVSAARRLRSVG
ncbi:MAG: DUF1016 domain-containing protein [Proteobacteria bacterium]|nr:DUF1016 domain-containing protein [Pseudomonadota bacterium]